MSLGSLCGTLAPPSAHGMTDAPRQTPALSCLSRWVALFLLIHKFSSPWHWDNDVLSVARRWEGAMEAAV